MDKTVVPSALLYPCTASSFGVIASVESGRLPDCTCSGCPYTEIREEKEQDAAKFSTLPNCISSRIKSFSYTAVAVLER